MSEKLHRDGVVTKLQRMGMPAIAQRQPAVFVSHGAALLTTRPSDPAHSALRTLGARIRAGMPDGIVVVSSHFVAESVRVTSGETLATVHDHPATHLFNYKYPGHGSPALARRVQSLLHENSIPCHLDAERGLDHGAWVPLSIMLPQGAVPVVELSLHAGEHADFHLHLGQALAPLRDESVVILGSGGSTHNAGAFKKSLLSGRGEPMPAEWSTAFDSWLTDTLTHHSGAERAALLERVADQPQMGEAHPTDEHLMPLLVVVGAAGDSPGQKVHHGFQHHLSMSAFIFPQ